MHWNRLPAPTSISTPIDSRALHQITCSHASRTSEYPWDLGLGVAEAMDTAKRGMGLDWPNSLELIGRSAAAAKARGGLQAIYKADSLERSCQSAFTADFHRKRLTCSTRRTAKDWPQRKPASNGRGDQTGLPDRDPTPTQLPLFSTRNCLR